jgi:FKBP-type peptidyl-prolyl cis-trans isomerase (trigger factor)
VIEYLEKNSSIKNYPDGTVNYYAEQLKAQYRYYADQAGVKYEELLDQLSEDNFTMQAEAKALVKKDMILELIRKRERITLTDEEKSAFFDRYVKKYAESYNYDEKYVREELSELVYESMLYDKTLEFLIINNTFVESGDAESEK